MLFFINYCYDLSLLDKFVYHDYSLNMQIRYFIHIQGIWKIVGQSLSNKLGQGITNHVLWDKPVFVFH